MSVKVFIGNHDSVPYPITSDAGKLRLPSILVEPADANQAIVAIKSIRVRIAQGDPVGQLILGPAYAVDGFLKQFEKPHRLTQRIECPPFSVQLKKQKFPAGQYLLRAEVVYQQAPPFPGAKAGPDATAFTERYIEVPTNLSYACSMKAGWKNQELVIGLNTAELLIYAENLPPATAPVVSVSDPNDVLIPSLRDALNHHLSIARPTLLREASETAPAVFQQKIEFRFDSPDRDLAIKSAPIPVDLRIAVKKGQSGPDADVDLAALTLTGRFALLIDFKENMFPGYPILDLGTSSTFALVYYFYMQTGDLPVEQEQTIRGALQSWLTRKDGPFGMPEWPAILQNATKHLGNGERGDPEGKPGEALLAYLKQNPPRRYRTDVAVHTALRALELAAAAPNASREFRLLLRREMSAMYARAFRRFPLEQQLLKAVELDANREAKQTAEQQGAIVAPIPSTTEVKVAKPLSLDMGFDAEANRLAATVASPESLVTKFHSSPKNYYPLLGRPGARIDVSADGPVESISPRAFLVGALKQLRDRIEKFRDRSDDLPKKRFSKIVMPFPTSAPLSVRQELLTAAKEAGFDNPIADLDEALSAVVFYLVNPFGADLEMGLEAFRTSCRPVPRGEGLLPIQWKQNILLIDVGGGTTDIALIEVTLEDAQAKGAGDGSKGRYYRLIPKLLGATGQAQLAGNLLSLGVFHAIKKRLADAILSALRPGAALPADQDSAGWQRLQKVAAKVPAAFRGKGTDRYRPGALLEHYLIHQLWQKKGESFDAFQLANEILPTAWKTANMSDADRTAAARTFHMLWQIADDMKIKVFGSTGGDANRSAAMSVEQIAQLLGVAPAVCQTVGIQPVSITRGDFWEAIDLPLREIAKLALDLTVTSLPFNTAPGRAQEGLPGILDRIILTGQTCRLGRVREVIKRTFQAEADSPNARLHWDPNALTFDGDYAKQAAALGAAYAQLLREVRVSPKVEDALNGNVLDIDIQNLFFFLQSGFYVRNPNTPSGRDALLTPGLPFREFDFDGIGHVRSDWQIAPREMLYIDRFDFAADVGVPWGHFDCKTLVEALGITFKEFQEEMRMAIATDHRLIVSVLFCRGREPHYELPSGGDFIDIPAVLRQLQIIPPLPPQKNNAAAPVSGRAWMDGLGDWVVGINVHSGFSGAEGFLFRLLPAELTKILRHPRDKKQRRGELSAELPACPESGIDKFYVRPRDNSRAWIEIGQLKRPQAVEGRHVSTRALLDDSGQLRIHLGDLPLFLACEDKDLLDHGVVLRKSLISATPLPDDLRNPFCGRH